MALVERLAQEGFAQWPRMLDAQKARALQAAILGTRMFDQSLFLTEAEWDAGPKSHARTNPGPGFNLLEKMEEKLDFIHADAGLNAMLTMLLGEGFCWYQKKLVCRLTREMIPAWLLARFEGKPANSFGAFIRPEYRDIGYFYDADLHQDIHDYPRWPQKEHRLLTFYVYLDEVGVEDAPLLLLPGTHVLGVTDFQHDVRRDGEQWYYRDGRGSGLRSRMEVMTGGAGHVGLWHSCLLHGSGYVRSGRPRISLRYLVGRGKGSAPCGLDAINAQVAGPLYPVCDSTAGHTAGADGMWTMRSTDFMRMVAA